MAVLTNAANTPNGVSPATKTTHLGGSQAQAQAQDKTKAAVDIIDIRSAAVEINLKEEINCLFKPKDGPRKLPTLLLYNERGLQLFEEVLPTLESHHTVCLGTNCSLDHIPG